MKGRQKFEKREMGNLEVVEHHEGEGVAGEGLEPEGGVENDGEDEGEGEDKGEGEGEGEGEDEGEGEEQTAGVTWPR